MVGIASTIRSGKVFTSTFGSGTAGGVSDFGASFLGSLTGGGLQLEGQQDAALQA